MSVAPPAGSGIAPGGVRAGAGPPGAAVGPRPGAATHVPTAPGPTQADGAAWSPAAALLAQLASGESVAHPQLASLPPQVRAQLAEVLASRITVLVQAAGLAPAQAPVLKGALQVDGHGRLAVGSDHPQAPRLQAVLANDPLVLALVRYLHVAAPVELPAARNSEVLPYVRGEGIAPANDAARVPGHPFASAAPPVAGDTWVRGITWAVGAAVTLLVLASML